MKDKLRAVFVPIASVVIGIIVKALIIWLFRYDTVKGYEALFNRAFGKPFNIGQTPITASPPSANLCALSPGLLRPLDLG